MNDTEGKKTTIRRYLLASLRTMSLSIKEPVGYHDTQNNDTCHNCTKHNDFQHNNKKTRVQHNDTRLNGSQHNNFQFNNKKTRRSA